MNQTTLLTRRIPPTIQDVMIYFSQKGMPEPEAEAFFLLHEKRGWTGAKGGRLYEWKSAARNWIGFAIQNYPWLFDRTLQ